jgi:peptidoglycan/xylan/chitin deacetylase (PgdA/CDA1 family)
LQKTIIGISILTLFLLGCGGLNLFVSPLPTVTPTWTSSPLPSPTQYPTTTPISFPTNTPTLPPTETSIPTFTFTPTLTPEVSWIFQGPGDVVVPILLYHHIGYSLKGESDYYVSPEAFDQQMNLLYQWGYKTISIELLARAVTQGAELPPKPVILTFDDGSDTVASTAQPIMQRYGFTGISYVIYYTIGLTHYMNVDQIRALHAAGWEVGSHSLTHKDLTIPPYRHENEIVHSRHMLETKLGVPVLSFAYPFGAYDESSVDYVHFAGYIAAMGLGNESVQGEENLFYLYRQAIKGTDDLRAFGARLPWRQEQYDLPVLTIVP